MNPNPRRLADYESNQPSRHARSTVTLIIPQILPTDCASARSTATSTARGQAISGDGGQQGCCHVATIY